MIIMHFSGWCVSGNYCNIITTGDCSTVGPMLSLLLISNQQNLLVVWAPFCNVNCNAIFETILLSNFSIDERDFSSSFDFLNTLSIF